MKNWAYTFALNHEGANVRNIYYTEKYFAKDGLVNPASGKAYTDDELKAIRTNAGSGSGSYIYEVRDDALIGMQAFNTGKTFWYDEENGRKITASAAPLLLDGETGEFRTAEGELTAVAAA